jgi:hypothetical protein
MALYLETRQIAIWQFSPNLSPEENVKVALMKMASFRQATVGVEALELYTDALKDLDLRAFQVAMASLAETPREQWQTAFPDFGTILELMDEAREMVLPTRPHPNLMPVMEGEKTKLLPGKQGK